MDYRELLIKYINFVGFTEGTTFIDSMIIYDDNNDDDEDGYNYNLKSADIKELKILDEEALKLKREN